MVLVYKIKIATMKNFIHTLLLVVITLVISCSVDCDKGDGFLPPLDIYIVDEIKENKDLVAMIKSSEIAINSFSKNIEQLAVQGNEILMKEQEDQTLIDNMKMRQLLLQFKLNNNQIQATVEKFTIYVEIQKEQGKINETQLKALEPIVGVFNFRLNEINKKHQSYLYDSI